MKLISFDELTALRLSAQESSEIAALCVGGVMHTVEAHETHNARAGHAADTVQTVYTYAREQYGNTYYVAQGMRAECVAALQQVLTAL